MTKKKTPTKKTKPAVLRGRLRAFRHIPIDQIVAVKQVRGQFKEIASLAASIDAEGLIQPITVRPDPKSTPEDPRYIIVAGERRTRAIRMLREEDQKAGRPLRFDTVEAMLIRTDDRKQILVTQIAENEARFQLRPWEAGRGMLELRKLGLALEDISERVGRSRSWVAQQIRFAENLAPKVLAQLNNMPPELVGQRLLDRLARLTKLDSKGRRVPDGDRQLALLMSASADPKRGKRPTNQLSVRRKLGALQVDVIEQIEDEGLRRMLEQTKAYIEGRVSIDQLVEDMREMEVIQ